MALNIANDLTFKGVFIRETAIIAELDVDMLFVNRDKVLAFIIKRLANIEKNKLAAAAAMIKKIDGIIDIRINNSIIHATVDESLNCDDAGELLNINNPMSAMTIYGDIKRNYLTLNDFNLRVVKTYWNNCNLVGIDFQLYYQAELFTYFENKINENSCLVKAWTDRVQKIESYKGVSITSVKKDDKIRYKLNCDCDNPYINLLVTIAFDKLLYLKYDKVTLNDVKKEIDNSLEDLKFINDIIYTVKNK